MDAFTNPKFCREILSIAQAFGPYDFWYENLDYGKNPDATWRALLVVGCLKDDGCLVRICKLLISPDSRVRAWACFALGQIKSEIALEQIYAMNADPSNRVRVHAWQAIQTIVGPEESKRQFPIRKSPRHSLIMVSTDSVMDQLYFSKYFKQMGYQVIIAPTEKETLEKSLKIKPDAIVTDNQKIGERVVDNLSGINMTWDICRQTKLRETIIIMISSDFVEPIFIWSGGDYYISKRTITKENLGKVIVEYLNH